MSGIKKSEVHVRMREIAEISGGFRVVRVGLIFNSHENLFRATADVLPAIYYIHGTIPGTGPTPETALHDLAVRVRRESRRNSPGGDISVPNLDLGRPALEEIDAEITRQADAAYNRVTFGTETPEEK